MFELKTFQSDSARLIAQRFAFYAYHPDRPRKGDKARPYFQALSALTGAGKTPILAQAVVEMRAHLVGEPIVLWMSKARPVVSQTYLNFSPSGKYHEILEGFRIVNVQDISPALIVDQSTPLLVMTTTGLFNNKDQAEGDLNIYKRGQDLFGDKSPWQHLIERGNGVRRPMIIVYDEGHNLSEQQTNILMELEADSYLLASATLKLPTTFQKAVVQHLKNWVEETDDANAFRELKSTNKDGEVEPEYFITTTVSSEDVVEAQLVKKAIQFDGTTAPMEQCLDDLMKRLGVLDKEIQDLNLGFRPKAIYVCRTNITAEGDKDDPSKPFQLRQAPPIRIWRYLVEEKGVQPKDIAIYADLKFIEGNKPDEVNLFSKKDSDFDEFHAGDYQHIIFNLSLQEGWDDPACYLAYVDKSMGSTVQVEQIIGRTLRQYGATHYDNPLLNSAHFFLRVDSESVFSKALDGVKRKLQSEGAPIVISSTFGRGGVVAEDLLPKSDINVSLHQVFVDSSEAAKQIQQLVDDFPIYSEGDPNTVGEAHAATEIVELIHPDKNGNIEWKTVGHTNPVRLRWLASMAIRSRSSRALAVIKLEDPKFDVRVQIQSRADKQIERFAQEVVSTFLSVSSLSYESTEPFHFGTIRVSKGAHQFNNGLYERYSGFNKFELPFAEVLDKLGTAWHRNPSNGGFHIPLLTEGSTASFYPDFIVWKQGKVFCLDTKGGHLLGEAVARKLFDIQEDGRTRIWVRFISEGHQTELRGKVTKGGYTVWKMKNGAPTPVFAKSLEAAANEALR